MLVIRGELLLKYPDTVIAQEADWLNGDPAKRRVLKDDGVIKFPSFHARLDPDVTIVGLICRKKRLAVIVDSVRQTRAGAPRVVFCAERASGASAIRSRRRDAGGWDRTWDDLGWDQIKPDGASYVGLQANNSLDTRQSSPAAWGRTSADMAYILFQSPIMYARHAEEMLENDAHRNSSRCR